MILQKQAARRAGRRAYLVVGVLLMAVVVSRGWNHLHLGDEHVPASALVALMLLVYYASYRLRFDIPENTMNTDFAARLSRCVIGGIVWIVGLFPGLPWALAEPLRLPRRRALVRHAPGRFVDEIEQPIRHVHARVGVQGLALFALAPRLPAARTVSEATLPEVLLFVDYSRWLHTALTEGSYALLRKRIEFRTRQGVEFRGSSKIDFELRPTLSQERSA